MTICSNLSAALRSPELEHRNSNEYQRRAVNYVLLGPLEPANTGWGGGGGERLKKVKHRVFLNPWFGEPVVCTLDSRGFRHFHGFPRFGENHKGTAGRGRERNATTICDERQDNLQHVTTTCNILSQFPSLRSIDIKRHKKSSSIIKFVISPSRQFTTTYDIFCPVPFLPSSFEFRRVMSVVSSTKLLVCSCPGRVRRFS